MRRLILVDERPPLTLTSDKSTECYRNWWPGPGSGMVDLMNRSIDKLDAWAHDSGNPFQLNRRGYLFATGRQEQAETYLELGTEISQLGAGPLRVHRGEPGDPDYRPQPAEGFLDQPTGADLLLDRSLIQRYFPYLTDDTVAVLHARRCGWFSAQQLGQFLLSRARHAGVELVEGKLETVQTDDAGISGVTIATGAGDVHIDTRRLVIAAGPKINEVAGLLGQTLPVYCELHSKVAMADPLGAVPRAAPLLIWSDRQQIPWSASERVELAADPETRWLTEPLPEGAHTRPEGPDSSPIILILWTYHTHPVEPVFPVPHDTRLYPEVALRGMSTMIPGLRRYFDQLPRPVIDGGYYVKTQENRPLITPLPVDGAYLIGALSGFGLMASPAAGELLAAHVVGGELPAYERWFRLDRYQDPTYQVLLRIKRAAPLPEVSLAARRPGPASGGATATEPVLRRSLANREPA
jgi:glycine/D-amino acid oxidase-like deaminating enzyme